MEFEEWVETVPVRLKSESLWKSKYYQLAMYLYELVWEDCKILNKDLRGREIAKQIIRSSGSICANIEEGFGRGVGTPDHSRILRIALGEARETKGWYFRSRKLLPEDLINHRLDIIGQVIALLVKAVSLSKTKRA